MEVESGRCLLVWGRGDEEEMEAGEGFVCCCCWSICVLVVADSSDPMVADRLGGFMEVRCCWGGGGGGMPPDWPLLPPIVFPDPVEGRGIC